MLVPLEAARLHNGETVEVAAIRGPDLEWADRIEALLGHKPPFWSWQNSAVVRRELGLDAHFYVLHRGGVPFSHVLTTEVRGVGILGHVFTREEERRKGAARALMERQLEHFGARSGRALYLRTEHASVPYRLYEKLGFRAAEPGSRVMELYRGEAGAFHDAWFAPGPAEVVEPAWPHWPASAPLFLADSPEVVRCVGRGLLGREITEGPFLAVLRDHEAAASRGDSSTARVLVQADTKAVVGFAQLARDPKWPAAHLVDLHCHPTFAAQGETLLRSLPLPDGVRLVAHADVGQEWKEAALSALGFARTAVLPDWVAADAERTRFADVGVWTRRR